MIEDIKEAMKEKKVLFGICECIKNIDSIEKIFLSEGARQETENKIKEIIRDAKSNANCEILGMGKEELSKKLALNFSCEVFSICKKPVERGRKDVKNFNAKKENVIKGKGNKEDKKREDKTKK